GHGVLRVDAVVRGLPAARRTHTHGRSRWSLSHGESSSGRARAVADLDRRGTIRRAARADTSGLLAAVVLKRGRRGRSISPWECGAGGGRDVLTGFRKSGRQSRGKAAVEKTGSGTRPSAPVSFHARRPD